MISPRSIRTLPLVLLAAAAALAGCESATDSGIDLPPGTFHVWVTGDTTFSLSGQATHGQPQMTLTDQGREGPTDDDFIQLFVPARLETGRNGEIHGGHAVLFVVEDGMIARQFLSTSGTVEVTRVTSGSVVGLANLFFDEWAVSGAPIPDSRIQMYVEFNAARPDS